MNSATRNTLFSSAKAEWATPQDLFDQLNSEFHFDLDAAADASNHKCVKWFGPGTSFDGNCGTDALAVCWQDYGTVIWCNPPYGRGIGAWVKAGWEASFPIPGIAAGATVVMLLPARTDTKWFHEFCVKGEIRFIKGRLKFGGADAAPFPSMVVIFQCSPLTPYSWARF